MIKRRLLLLLCITCLPVSHGQVRAPVKTDSFRFGIIGDSGTGDRPALEIGAKLAEVRKTFPFDIVVMLGDNMYGRERPSDFVEKFELPYKALLDGGVKFYASLGNHDEPNQRNYKLFNMGGRRYYSFSPHKDVRFFALDSTYMDKAQLSWIEDELKNSNSDWKICFFHHPIYSSGKRHGSSMELRAVLEPLFVKYKVSLVLSGHEHFYERLKPQRGIHYFISGAAAKLRRGNIGKSEMTAKGFDQDRSVMVMEISGDQAHFQAISRIGEIVDSGTFERGNR